MPSYAQNDVFFVPTDEIRFLTALFLHIHHPRGPPEATAPATTPTGAKNGDPPGDPPSDAPSDLQDSMISKKEKNWGGDFFVGGG